MKTLEDAREYLERMKTFPGKNDGLDHLRNVIAVADEARADKEALVGRLIELSDIMTDIQYQLEQTKGGYYIYRFNLETMHRIADALGIEPTRVDPNPVLDFYTPEELTKLITPA